MENNIKNSYRLKTQQISAKMNWFSLDYIFNDILDVSEGNSRKKRQNYNNVATKYKSCANKKNSSKYNSNVFSSVKSFLYLKEKANIFFIY